MQTSKMATTDRSGLRWSWLGFLLITTHVGLSTQQFIGFTCEEVCDSLLSNRSSNWSYFFTLVPNSNTSEEITPRLNFCDNENGTIPDTVAVSDSVNIDIANTPCARVYEEDYSGVKLQIINTSLNASGAPSINASSCMRACAVCKVNLPYASSCERDETCEDVTKEDATNCTRTELGVFQSEDELWTKLRSINESYDNYKRVLDRVVPGVLIMDGDKPMCLAAYRKWLCRTRLPILLWTSEELLSLRPCLEVCWEVLVECPFFLPAQLQFSRKEHEFQEEQYAGTPVFDCPGVESVTDNNNSRYRVCAPHPTGTLQHYNRTCL